MPMTYCMALHTPLAATHHYKVDKCYAPYQPTQTNDDAPSPPLHRILCDIDPNSFPSLSQARKAIQHGRLIVVHADQTVSKDADIISQDTALLDVGTVVNSETTLQSNDVLAIRSRIPNEFYSQACTQYVDPPPNTNDIFLACTAKYPIVYEDDSIAVVNKPEGIDTIGTKRNDLQSILPFILHPPKLQKSRRPRKNTQLPCYIPRPIHRLDRKTSGCVLIAKSESSMKKYSIMFATRQIQKSYCAIVFGEPKVVTPALVSNNDKEESETTMIEINGKTASFNTIDYPIDGKDAITLWRILKTIPSHPTLGTISLLQLLPKTGRNHQIRRHLSYCLSCPIVGDSKYDGGGMLAKEARGTLGMFLCSNSIEFDHHVMLKEDEDGCDRRSSTTILVDIPLPDKFHELLGLDREKDVLV